MSWSVYQVLEELPSWMLPLGSTPKTAPDRIPRQQTRDCIRPKIIEFVVDNNNNAEIALRSVHILKQIRNMLEI